AGGWLSGTATAGGSFRFTIQAADSASNVGFQAYPLTVNAPTIPLSPASLSGGTVGAAYSQTVSASGSTTPFHFAITAGSLPPGLFLNQDTGVISGVPTTASGSPFNFTVQATDSSTGTGPFTGSRAYSLTVNALSSATLTATSISGMGLGTVQAGKGITIKFQATVNNPYTGGHTVSNQGTVSGSNFANVLTDDPAVGGTADPTLTTIDLPDVTVAVSPASVTEDGATNLVY